MPQDTGLSGDIGGLQSTLDTVYNAMIVHCADLTTVSQGIAAIATLCYACNKVWEQLATNEPFNFYVLLRPFAISLLISTFPTTVVGVINGFMQPVVTETTAIVNNSNQAVATLLQEKEQALQQSNDWQMYVGSSGSGDLSKWEALSGESDSGMFSGISNRVKFEMAKASYNLRNSVKVWLSEILQVLFEAAALCINTVRTFYLIILAICGPLVFGMSIFEPFRHILANWLGRYLNVFLWLPVANIFGSLIAEIQQEMIKLDIAQLSATGTTTFGPTDSAYIIFLLLAIVGYFTVPSVAGYIINGNSMGSHLSKLNKLIKPSN